MPSNRVTARALNRGALIAVGSTSGGSELIDWRYRSMSRLGDDETVTYEVAAMLSEEFQLVDSE